MYIVRMKKSKEVVLEHPASLDKKLKGKDIYPAFNSKTMELLKYDGDTLPPHYKVTKDRFLVPKTAAELAGEGLIEFGDDLGLYGVKVPAADDSNLQNIKLALELKLVKSLRHCEEAFRMLDDEFEARVARLYRPGMEAKLMKDYMAWLEEGKPADDKREKKYLDMKETIDAIKDEYKEVRAKLKEIIVPLKEQNA